MLTPKTIQRRLQRRLKRAQDPVDVQGMTIRDAAERFHIPKSTLHDSI